MPRKRRKKKIRVFKEGTASKKGVSGVIGLKRGKKNVSVYAGFDPKKKTGGVGITMQKGSKKAKGFKLSFRSKQASGSW